MRVELQRIQGRAAISLQKIECDIEADAARADDDDARARLDAAGEDIDVARDARVLDTGDLRLARVDSGRDHDLIEIAKLVFRRCGVQPHLGPRAPQALGVIGDRLGELLLAGDTLGEVELAAELARLLEERYRVAALGRDRGAREARRAAAHDRDAFFRLYFVEYQNCFPSGPRIHDAARRLADEVMVEAGLVAGDADVDPRAVARSGFVREFGVRQHCARERHHVRVAARDDVLGDLGRVDAVGGDHGDLHGLFQPPRRPGKARTRHGLRDRGDARLVPADAGVEDRRARALDRARDLERFLAREAAFDQVERRDAVDDDELRTGGDA